MSHSTKWSRAFITKTIITVVILLIAIQYLVNVAVFKQTGPVIFIRVLDSSVEKMINRSVPLAARLSLRHALTKMSKPSATPVDLCPVISPKLKGFQKPTTQVGAWAFLEEQNPNVMPGGRFKPADCQARHRVAIVIPFRDREIHLKIFLRNMHPFLQRQQLDYGIFVVEMAQNITFNRALLMNVGFVEALKRYNYDCFIFHDVDLLPEDDRNLYTCPTSPRHMSVAIDRMKYMLPYPQIFGGVCAISVQDFKKINGFSNLYFGWGGEDDDMYRRLVLSNLTVIRYTPEVARYKMLVHAKDQGNKDRFALLRTVKARHRTEGLNSLTYQVIKSELKPLYTWVLIVVNETQILENEPIHKVAFQNLHKKTPPQKAVNLQEQSKQESLSNVNNSSPNVQNSNKDNIKQKDAKAPIAEPYVSVREWSKKRLPKVISWVPEQYEGEIPAHLSTLKALPKPEKIKPGQQNNKQVAKKKDLSVQGRVKAQQKESIVVVTKVLKTSDIAVKTDSQPFEIFNNTHVHYDEPIQYIETVVTESV